ncbi:MAG TPA: aquaporin family protein [Chloroflexi bacterium]|nr:aquaporin family protein [Chloroflexota bacterium]
MNFRASFSELIGTFALIFIGAGAAAIDGELIVVALAHGMVIIGLAYAYGHHSGNHINPAVTFGLLIAGEIKTKTAINYWIMQFAGGILGAAALSFVLGGSTSGLGATQFDTTATNVSQALVLELILTFLLVNTIMNTAVSGKAGNLAGLAIGSTLIFCILMGGPITGASLNPARTLGPALLTGNLDQLWVYIVGPLAGAAIASIFYVNVLKDKS